MKKPAKEPCDYCHGHLGPRIVEVTRGHGEKMVIIQGVPALVCDHCGERYYDAEVVRSVEKLVKKRRHIGRKIQVPVAKFEVVA